MANLPSDSEHLHFVRELDYILDAAEDEVVNKGVELGFAIGEGIIGAAEIIQSGGDAAARVTCAVGTFGACTAIAATGASHTVLKIANAVKYAANVVSASVMLADAVASKNDAKKLRCDYDTMMINNIGVTYESGSADYAEWLPKVNAAEKFTFSDIVGVKGGRISKNTDNAEQFMVVSMKPIVLGNSPATGKSKEYEKVAFMGQVPVRVLGMVKLGDYILPSGGNNGLGIAVSPANMKHEDYKKIVGVAWSEGNDPDLNTIRVAVGLNTNSLAAVIEKQAEEIRSLKQAVAKSDEKIDQINSTLAMLVPGYKQTMKLPANSVKPNSNSTNGGDYLDKVLGSVNSANNAQVPQSAHISQAQLKANTSITPVGMEEKTSDKVVVPSTFFTDDVMKQAFADAQEMFVKGGGNVEADPFFSRISSDPAYREIAMRKIQNHLNKVAFDQVIANSVKNTPKK